MIELKLVRSYPRELIALDEVGRSPLSGPVVVGALRVRVPDAAVLETLVRSFRRNGVKDSKALSGEARARLLEKLGVPALPFRKRGSFRWKGLDLAFITWEMDHAVIDRENIYRASLRGMREAAASLQTGPRDEATLLIDGPSTLRGDRAEPWEEIPLVKGDVRSSLVGLAAVVAKEARDAHMREMHARYPGYGFDTNVGYPTRAHRRAIAELGPCPIHRRSFGTVRAYVAPDAGTGSVG
jgi:ribonuclease HII